MYLLDHVKEPTPQTEPLPGREDEMVKNRDVGYVFPVDEWTRLRRFLIIGSEGGTYYMKERKLTQENITCVGQCLDSDPDRTLQEVINASSFSAAKNDQALFVLAMAASHKDESVRKKALDWSVLSKVARQGSHILQFVSYVDSMRKWSRMLRSGISNWYLNRTPSSLAFQTLKYRNRFKWTHEDVLNKAHADTVHPEFKALFDWITKGNINSELPVMQQIMAFEECKTATPERIIELINEFNLTREMLPTEALRYTAVWHALLPKMPIIALTRNLGNMTSKGVFTHFGEHTDMVVDRFTNAREQDLRKLHPLNVLVTLFQYRSGRGDRGNLTWTPIPQIVSVLDSMFHKTFSHSEPTGKRFYLGVDVSGSMNYGYTGVRGMTAMQGAVTMAMAIARIEPRYYIAGFSHELRELNFTAQDSLQHAIDYVDRIPYGATNCAMPMIDALQKRIPVDCFIILTDYETNYGRIHPCVALENYRKEMGIASKLITVSMTADDFTIADPADSGSIDIVGFDGNIINLIKGFMEV